MRRLTVGLEALRNLGQEFPPNPDIELAFAKLSELLDHLERDPPDYFSMPELNDQDPELLAISEILLTLGNAAFISRPALAPLIFVRSLELSLERHFRPEPWKLSTIGLFANALLGKIELAHEYTQTAVVLAVALQQTHPHSFARPRLAQFTFGASPCGKPWTFSIARFRVPTNLAITNSPPMRHSAGPTTHSTLRSSWHASRNALSSSARFSTSSNTLPRAGGSTL